MCVQQEWGKGEGILDKTVLDGTQGKEGETSADPSTCLPCRLGLVSL